MSADAITKRRATAIGAVAGPSWPLAIAGGAIVLIGLLATMVMKAMGFGQP